MVTKEILAQLEKKDSRVTLVCKAPQGPPESRGQRAQWVPLDHLEKLDQRVLKVFPAPKEMKDQEDLQVFLDFQDYKDCPDLKVVREIQEIQVKEDHQDHQGHRDLLAHQEPRERPELRVHRVQKDLEVQRVILVYLA